MHQSEMSRISLLYVCWLGHPLVQLAEQIPSDWFAGRFGEQYCLDNGHPNLPIRMMVGLLLLKHARGLLDKEVVEWWLDSPYAQYFCGETYFQQESYLDSSSLSRFRICISESGCELILKSTMMAGRCLEEKRLEPSDVGYQGTGEGGDVSDQSEIAEPCSRAFGEEGTDGRFEASPKLCASGSEAAFEGEPLCACASDECDAEHNVRIILKNRFFQG